MGDSVIPSVSPYPTAQDFSESRTDQKINSIVVTYCKVLSIPARVSMCWGLFWYNSWFMLQVEPFPLVYVECLNTWDRAAIRQHCRDSLT
jgi:hypothetical protein